MGRTKEYELLASDRIKLVESAVDLIVVLNQRDKGEEWKRAPLTELEEKAYTTALALLIKEFRLGPTQNTTHLISDIKD